MISPDSDVEAGAASVRQRSRLSGDGVDGVPSPPMSLWLLKDSLRGVLVKEGTGEGADEWGEEGSQGL